MKVVTLRCANCGAPLSVKHRARFVACNFCDSQLEIHREKSATYSTTTDNTHKARTRKLEKSIERLQFTNELERLDQAWLMEQDQYMKTGDDGERSVASHGSALGTLVTGVGLVVFTLHSLAYRFPAPVTIIAGLVSLAVFASALHEMHKADRYKQARHDYERRRYDLLARMNRPKGG